MSNKEVNLLDYQYDFISSNDSNLCLLGGVGTGKTFVGSNFVLRMVSEFPHTKGMICANTYSQLTNSTLTPLFNQCEELGIPFKTAINAKRIHIMNTMIYVYSLENYDTIRGIEVGWIWVDEFFLLKDKQAYDVIKTRLRCKNGPLFFRGTSTKNGFNWGYDMYSAPDSNPEFKTIEATTYDNPFLPSQFINDLINDYGSVDAPMFKQEVLNKYVNLTAGAVYWSFDRKKHVSKVNIKREYFYYVGMDFNIDNMNALITYVLRDTLYIAKEVCLSEHNSNTEIMAMTLQNDMVDMPYRSIVPDSTGKARKTSSTKSDHQILRDHGFRVETTTNPLIRDRQNAVNRRFAINRIVIDESCVKLIKELESLAKRDDEGKEAHISVALGYIVYKLWPLKKQNGRSRTKQL